MGQFEVLRGREALRRSPDPVLGSNILAVPGSACIVPPGYAQAGGPTVTVAIAALCQLMEAPAIIAAEDHMITAGDVEFEQPQPKIWTIGPHAIGMIFGDMGAQAEIAALTEREVVMNGVRDVGQIAAIYVTHLTSYVRHRAEAGVLAPLGITAADLMSANSPDLAARLARQLQDYAYDAGLVRHLGGAIIAGADVTGGHIWRVGYEERVQLDAIGFAAAGSGQWHAESEFMFARYTRAWDFPEALSLVYSAKKRAEVAPGVGTETDVVVIGTSPPSVTHFRNDSPLLDLLAETYSKWEAKRDEINAERLRETREKILEMLNPPPQDSGPEPGP